MHGPLDDKPGTARSLDQICSRPLDMRLEPVFLDDSSCEPGQSLSITDQLAADRAIAAEEGNGISQWLLGELSRFTTWGSVETDVIIEGLEYTLEQVRKWKADEEARWAEEEEDDYLDDGDGDSGETQMSVPGCPTELRQQI